MRGIILIFICFLSIPGLAQHRPDLSDIRKQVTKEKSDNYYPEIYEKLMTGDKPLQADSYHYLYYGYGLSQCYTAENSLFASNALRLLSIESLDSTQLVELHTEADSLITRRAIDPEHLFIKYYSLSAQGHREKASLWFHHFTQIMDAIMNSGDGKSEETAIWILYPDHHILVLEALDVYRDGEIRFEEEFMIIPLRSDSEIGSELYFNVSMYQDNLDDWERGRAEKRKLGCR